MFRCRDKCGWTRLIGASAMQAFYCDEFLLPLPAAHRFPQDKYRAVRVAVTRDGRVDRSDLHVPDAASAQDVLRVHDEVYWWRVLKGDLSHDEGAVSVFP